MIVHSTYVLLEQFPFVPNPIVSRRYYADIFRLFLTRNLIPAVVKSCLVSMSMSYNERKKDV